MCERPGRPDVTSWGATRESQLGFSHEETHHDGTAQSVVNEVIPRERSGRPDVDPQRGAWPQQFVIGNNEAELELSVESRSFVNRVKDQVRKRHKRISNVTEDGEKHSTIWGMFMTVTMESAVFMGKNYLNNCQSIANTTDLTLKQMFDISTRLNKMRSLDWKHKRLLLRLDETPENFKGRIILMSMFKVISCGSKDNEKECLANAKLVSLYARRFGKGQWSFIGPVSEKKWYCISEDSPQGVWDNTAERMLVEFAESGCPIFRATSPLSRGRLKSQGHGKLSIHFAADLETIETIFRIIVSANQLSLYGAVAEICEEYESLHERTGRPVVMGQSSSSLVLSVIKTEVSLDCDDPSTKIFYCSNMENELKSCHNKTN